MKHHDYSAAGLYFITICTYQKECLFGEIKEEQMILNEAGMYALSCWQAIPDHFQNALLEDYIVMPNHIHGIIRLKQQYQLTVVDNVNVSLPFPYRQNKFQHMIPGSISAIVKGFKIGVTKWFRYGVDRVAAEYIQPLSNQLSGVKIWQRSFHDHIIRNEEEYYRIKNYIINNPKIGIETNSIQNENKVEKWLSGLLMAIRV